MTQKWKLTIEYDGTPFAGWQRQPNVLAVQHCIEDAIAAFSGQQPVELTVAGRTDAGVHALGQVAHVRMQRDDLDAKTMRDATNFHLRPHPVSILSAEKVADDFSARMSAVGRVYCYKIICNRRSDSVLLRTRAWHVAQDLDLAAMNAGARHLLGQHDFSTFRDSECQAKSPVRSIDRLEIIERADAMFGRHLEVWAEARSFLHHQIRNITGTLKLVGEGKWMPDDVKTALAARDRTKGGPTAPAHGLYFVRVDY